MRACGMGEGRVELGFECASCGEYSELELFDEFAVRLRGLSGANKGNAARFGALFGALVIREGVLTGKLFGCTYEGGLTGPMGGLVVCLLSTDRRSGLLLLPPGVVVPLTGGVEEVFCSTISKSAMKNSLGCSSKLFFR